MKKHTQIDLPGIAYVTAILTGVLLFVLVGESLLGIKPNMTWIAGITGFLFALGILLLWVHWHDQK